MGKVEKNKILPAMQAELTRDFKAGTRISELFPDPDKSGALIQMQFAGREALGKSYYIKRKNMDSFLFWFLRSGTKSVIRNNIIYNTTANCFAVEDCMEETVGWVTPSVDAENTVQYYIHFYPSPIVKSVSEYMLKYSPLIELDGDEFGFCDMIDDALDDVDNGTFDEYAWSKRFYSFFLDVAEYIKRTIGERMELPKAVSDTLEFIAHNYDRTIDLAGCAENVHLSPNYLDSMFSKHLHVSIYAYISKFRFKEATSLLISTDKSIAEIAACVGLTDSQALIRMFKKNIGMTPLSYRKYYKSK